VPRGEEEERADGYRCGEGSVSQMGYGHEQRLGNVLGCPLGVFPLLSVRLRRDGRTAAAVGNDS
jgi:hypothetical protein